MIPDAFIEELEDFSRGNSLAFLGNDEHHHEVHACCIRCIKAYALQRAREKNFSLSLLHFFDQFFEGEIGHEGYYIDQGKIVKY